MHHWNSLQSNISGKILIMQPSTVNHLKTPKAPSEVGQSFIQWWMNQKRELSLPGSDKQIYLHLQKY